MKPARLFTAAALALAAGVVTALPASANDAVSRARYDGAVRAVATYDDLTDTLCVRVQNYLNIDTAEAKMVPADGVGRTHRVVDMTDMPGTRCTGNLSIPEDKKYVLKLYWISESGPAAHGPNVTFYS